MKILQIVVVWFGQKVAWNNMKVECPGGKKWFIILSWCHVVFAVIAMLISNTMIINGLGNMGTKNLKGEGAWWDVRNPNHKIVWDVFTTCSSVLGIGLPLIQAQYLTYKGVKNISETHAVIFYVADNRKADQRNT